MAGNATAYLWDAWPQLKPGPPNGRGWGAIYTSVWDVDLRHAAFGLRPYNTFEALNTVILFGWADPGWPSYRRAKCRSRF